MIKFSLLLSVIAAPVNMSGQIITLNKPTTVGADDLYEFIYDRTFSFAGSNNANMLEYVGTGWIYKHISNYKYYLFTNWHVSDVMKATLAVNFASSSTNGTSVNNFDYDKTYGTPQWNNACYYSKDNVYYGVDAAIIEIDFGKLNTFSTKYKSRLDKLNEYADTHSDLMFNGYLTENDGMKNSRIYVGGYPASSWVAKYGVPTWYRSSTTINEIDRNFANAKKNHQISDGNSPKLVSISDGYYSPKQTYNTNSDLYYLGGGASGSVAIDENKSVVGLYWGGWSYTDGSGYATAFEVFSWVEDSLTKTLSSSHQSLFNDYIDGKFTPVKLPSKPSNWNDVILFSVVVVVGVVVIVGVYFAVQHNKKKNKKIK